MVYCGLDHGQDLVFDGQTSLFVFDCLQPRRLWLTSVIIAPGQTVESVDQTKCDTIFELYIDI